MSAENVVGLVLAVWCSGYLIVALSSRSGSDEHVQLAPARRPDRVLLITTRVLGAYIAGVFGGGKAPGDRVFAPVERLIYRVCGVDPEREQRWNVYAFSLLAFSLVSVLVLYVLQRLQGCLPFNPTDAEGSAARARRSTPRSASSPTRTGRTTRGESTMSHLTQMAGPHGAELRVGRRRARRRGRADPRPRPPPHARRSATSGSTSPAARSASCCRSRSCRARAREPGRRPELPRLHARARPCRASTQSIPGGPIASQEAIKELGENGGGPFNANSAHPFENPNGFTNCSRSSSSC